MGFICFCFHNYLKLQESGYKVNHIQYRGSTKDFAQKFLARHEELLVCDVFSNVRLLFIMSVGLHFFVLVDGIIPNYCLSTISSFKLFNIPPPSTTRIPLESAIKTRIFRPLIFLIARQPLPFEKTSARVFIMNDS